ncbi:MAG: efflux RND transporter permease subunit [Pseudomonadota bacterium]|nr:efflux RND transporter permease subunit [Pseudomonadota bacterium]
MPSVIAILIRYRWLFFLLSVGIMLFAGWGAKSMRFDGSPRVFFAKDNSEYQRFEAMEDTYGSDFKIFIMMSAREGSMLEPDNLRALREMTETAWTLPFVRRVDSLSNYQFTHSQNDELYVDDLFGDPVLENPALFAERRKVALRDPDIRNRLISADGNHAAVIMSLNLTYDETQKPEGVDLVNQTVAMAEAIEAKYPGVQTAQSGSLLSTVYNLQVAQSDMSLILPVMFGLMFLILGLLLRSVSAVVISLLVAICSAVGALGIASWFGITFSILSINAVIITIIVAVAHCIHIFTQLFRDLKTLSKRDALASSLRINFFAVSITSLTTVIGFLSLNTNDLPPAVDLGNAAAIGTAMAWLLSLTLLPAMVILLPFKAHKTSEIAIDRIMDRLADVIIKHKYAVFFSMSALCAVMITLCFQNELNDKLNETLHEPHVFRSDTTKIDEHFGAMYIYSFDLDSGEQNGIFDPDYLKNLDKFATWFRQQPEVAGVNAFSDIIKRLNKSMHNDDPAYYRIPDNRQLIAQYVLMYEMSLPFGLDLGEQVTPDRRYSLLTASMPTLDTRTDIALDQRVWAWQQANLPAEMQNRNISLATIWSYLTIHSLVNSLEGSAMALVLISLVLLVLLRSVRYGIISLVPNLIPAMFGFGVWYLYSGNVGLGLTCVAIITIGIVVDDTVHFLAKYKKALHDNQGDAELAVRATFHQVGSALFMTTAVLASGFAVLGMSKIIINSALGQVTAVILIAAYLLDILLLPAILLIVDRNRKRQYQPQHHHAQQSSPAAGAGANTRDETALPQSS